MQPWIYGYDAYAEVERAYRSKPFGKALEDAVLEYSKSIEVS